MHNLLLLVGASDSSSPFDGSLSSWLNFGVLGLLVIAAITGFIWFKPGVERLKDECKRNEARAEKAEAQRDAALEIAQEKMLPLLSQFVASTGALLPLLQELVSQRERERDRRRDE